MNEHWAEQAFAEHFRDVFRYAAAHLDRDEVEDAVAEVFAIALTKPAPEQPLHWLIGVARNVVYRGHHRRKRKQDLDERIGASPETAMDLRVEQSVALAETMHRLKPEERDVLALCLVEGFDRADVAEILDCSVNALNVRLHRAKENFKKHYTELTREEEK